MANRYWVGGTSTWDGLALLKWSTTSGGVGGAAVPTSSDAVYFDANSGANTVTISNNTAICSILTLTGFTGVFAFGSNSISIAGNNIAVFVTTSTSTFTVTGTPLVLLTYSGSTGTRTITTGSATTESNAFNFNITNGSDIIAASNFVAKSVNFTGFSGTLSNTVKTIYGNLIISSGMTITAGANTTTFAATSVTQQITTASKTLDFPITMSGTSTVQLQDNLTIGSTRTFTLTSGTLDLNNLTLTVGLFNGSNANTRSILFGTGNITAIGSGTVWTTATATNFSYTGTPTVNISNNSATATTVNTSGMTAAQALNFNYTTGTYTLTDSGCIYKNINFTGFTGTLGNSARVIYGSATFVSGMTLTAGVNTTTFAATSGTNNITTAKTWDFPIIFNGIGGTWAFQDALTQGSTRAFTITNGTVQLKASTTNIVGSFATSGTTVKYLQSTTTGTQATISQSSGTVNATYLTIKDSAATGGATWYALFTNNNVSSGDNSGWIFATPSLSALTTSTSTIGFQYTFAKLLSYLSTSVSTIKNLPNKLLSTTSTSVVFIQRFISKIFTTISEMSVVVITESAFHLILLSITESNVASIVKSISKTFIISSTSTVNLIKSVNKIISASVTSIVTMSRKYAVGKIISLSVSSTASLVKTAQKYLTVISTNTTTLIRSISVTLKAFSATITTLIFAVFPKLGAVVRYTFTADMRNDLIQLFKQRNVRANESNKKVQK